MYIVQDKCNVDRVEARRHKWVLFPHEVKTVLGGIIMGWMVYDTTEFLELGEKEARALAQIREVKANGEDVWYYLYPHSKDGLICTPTLQTQEFYQSVRFLYSWLEAEYRASCIWF